MRILIGGANSKIFHLKEFTDYLNKAGVQCKLVLDTDIQDGFPSRKIKNWIPSKTKFNKLITEFKPDVIFVDRQSHFGLAAINAKIPLIVQLRGDYWSELVWAKETLYKNPVKRMIIYFKDKNAQKCFRGASTILPICNHLTKIVKKRYPEKDVQTLYSGIDPSRWFASKGIKLEHPCVGLVQGAVIWGKTRELLTLKKVLETFPNVTFYWAGDGPYRDKVLPELEKFPNFKWLGNLEYPDKVREFLSEIDIYALISGIDMSPLTLQEAQLMRKPVIATNVGGIPELMKSDESGFLVEKGNPDDIIKKLKILLDDKERSKEMGENGQRYVKAEFNWEKVCQDFIKIAEQCMQNSKRTRDVQYNKES